jgi:hypothetical protein
MGNEPKLQSAGELRQDAARLRAMARLVHNREFAERLEEQALRLEALADARLAPEA